MVTGVCGFVGSHLVHRLVREGARRVVVVDDLRHGRAEVVSGLGVEIVRIALGSGDDAQAELQRAMRGVEGVFHLAAEKHNVRRDEPERIREANVTGTRALLEGAARSGVRKVVFSSSLYVYGRDRGAPFDEDEAPREATVYGASKLEGERLVAAFPGDSCSLRYMFVYGPRLRGAHEEPSLVARTFERLAAGKAPIIYGDGQQALDYVFVDDVVDATLRAMERSATGALNVGSGAGVTVEDLVRRITRLCEKNVEPERAPSDATAGTSRVARVERIARELGWRATTTLDQGLARVRDAMAR